MRRAVEEAVRPQKALMLLAVGVRDQEQAPQVGLHSGRALPSAGAGTSRDGTVRHNPQRFAGAIGEHGQT